MRKPNFDKLFPLFEAKEDFSLTETQYEKSTSASLPKNFYYLKQNSALAKIAKNMGMQLISKKKRSV